MRLGDGTMRKPIRGQRRPRKVPERRRRKRLPFFARVFTRPHTATVEQRMNHDRWTNEFSLVGGSGSMTSRLTNAVWQGVCLPKEGILLIFTICWYIDERGLTISKIIFYIKYQFLRDVLFLYISYSYFRLSINIKLIISFLIHHNNYH